MLKSVHQEAEEAAGGEEGEGPGVSPWRGTQPRQSVRLLLPGNPHPVLCLLLFNKSICITHACPFFLV